MKVTAVMVLAAGLGTRLRPLTDECPKPLVPIGDRPAIAHVLDRVRVRVRVGVRVGVRESPRVLPVVVNAHRFAEELSRALSHDRDVRVSHEPELLGTAGGLAHAAARGLLGDGDVLVWNADVLARLDASALAFAHGTSGADATLVVRPLAADRTGAGNVGLDHDGRIVRLRNESFAPGEVRCGEFLGIHVVGEALRARLPRAGCLVGDVYLPRGHAGANLRSFVTDIDFVDVGTLAAYVEANVGWLREQRIDSFVRTEVPAEVRVGRDVILPRDVSVTGAGLLERVVVWPGATVNAPLRDAIVTPSTIVRVPR